tara:strand:- start:53 stop:166 length:114 start_codon:yes stop_codon:yes gene_type:complete
MNIMRKKILGSQTTRKITSDKKNINSEHKNKKPDNPF